MNREAVVCARESSHLFLAVVDVIATLLNAEQACRDGGGWGVEGSDV